MNTSSAETILMPEGLPPSEMDRVAAQSREAIHAAMQARHDATDREQRHAAGNAIWRAHCVMGALRTLDAAFPRSATHDEPAPIPTGTTGIGGDTLDLRALTSINPINPVDTPETRALYSALNAIMPLAEFVDKQRGHTLPESIPTAPGETRGTDFAESVGELVLRLRGEVYGAKPSRE